MNQAKSNEAQYNLNEKLRDINTQNQFEVQKDAV